jgi:hypothetical protein
MKSNYLPFIFCFSLFTSVAQIPNGNFEEWQTIDNIETPIGWQTNNYYENSTPVEKEEEAIEGNYSMRISSTSLNVWGGNTQHGCAHIKFLPQMIYQSMLALVRIDSINMGEIAIRVKQRRANGLYEKIGSWKDSTLTDGVEEIAFDIEQTSLDTLLIEIWAFNTDMPFVNTGYSEAVIDQLSLSLLSSTYDTPLQELEWVVSPIPATDRISILLSQILTDNCTLRLIDLQGRVQQERKLTGISEVVLEVGDLARSIYILELRREDLILRQSLILLN